MSEGTNIKIEAKGTVEPIADPRRAVDLLRSWRDVTDEEAQDQRETLEFLMKALDEDRPSSRKLFP